MIFDNYTTLAITLYTKRKCIRFTELFHVVVAVFEFGRPSFISKRDLFDFVARQEYLNTPKLRKEWKIGNYTEIPAYKPQTSLETIKRRASRVLVNVEIDGDHVVGTLPSDSFDRVVAMQVCKENKWQIDGDTVTAA